MMFIQMHREPDEDGFLVFAVFAERGDADDPIGRVRGVAGGDWTAWCVRTGNMDVVHPSRRAAAEAVVDAWRQSAEENCESA